MARLYHGPRASEKPGTLYGRRRSEAQKCFRAIGKQGRFSCPIRQGSPARLRDPTTFSRDILTPEISAAG
jgi:hypothetical protein